jgi:hypothetical protein
MFVNPRSADMDGIPIEYAEVLKAVMPVKKMATARIAFFLPREKWNGFSLESAGKSTQIARSTEFFSSPDSTVASCRTCGRP